MFGIEMVWTEKKRGVKKGGKGEKMIKNIKGVTKHLSRGRHFKLYDNGREARSDMECPVHAVGRFATECMKGKRSWKEVKKGGVGLNGLKTPDAKGRS